MAVDGGIEELTEDLSGGKILYAYVKVIDPNTNLPKFVFINWVIQVVFLLYFLSFQVLNSAFSLCRVGLESWTFVDRDIVTKSMTTS